jgi:hypothetical protein
MKNTDSALLRLLLVMLVFATGSGLWGCGGPAGPKLGDVSGKVTLDGQPVADALVVFEPQEGRPARGMTDAEGNYQLEYTQNAKGAAIGGYTVRITTGRPASYAEGQKVSDEVKETIPEKYNAKSELKAEVSPGKNQINFDLQSK